MLHTAHPALGSSRSASSCDGHTARPSASSQPARASRPAAGLPRYHAGPGPDRAEAASARVRPPDSLRASSVRSDMTSSTFAAAVGVTPVGRTLRVDPRRAARLEQKLFGAASTAEDDLLDPLRDVADEVPGRSGGPIGVSRYSTSAPAGFQHLPRTPSPLDPDHRIERAVTDRDRRQRRREVQLEARRRVG